MKRVLIVFLAAMALLPASAPASSTPAPSWRVTSLAAPTNFLPGDTKHDYYQVEATNVGAAPTDSTPIVITDELPAGLTVKGVKLLRKSKGVFPDIAGAACKTQTAGESSTVVCTIDESVPGAFKPALVMPSERISLVIRVATPASASGPLVNRVKVEGGGAPSRAAEATNQASKDPAPPGLAEYAIESLRADGLEADEAGSHPFSFVTRFAANTELAPEGSAAPLLGAGGDLKDVEVRLPPGLVGNPTVAPKCSAKDFVTVQTEVVEGTTYYQTACPDASAVGVIAIGQVEGATNQPSLGPIYNIEPPPGMPAQFGFQVAGNPLYLDTEVRSDSDFGVTAILRNSSQAKRVTAANVTIWGVPADPIHDPIRGNCAEAGGSCPAGIEPLPFLRMPTSCAAPLLSTLSFDTWLTPGAFHQGTSTSPAPDECSQPEFDPSIEVATSSGVADSPTGFDVTLRIPQNEDPEGIGTADLRDATVTLPEGLLVNPASADGLASCSPAEIGMLTPVGQVPPRFSRSPAQCPDASKVGSVEVNTPLLEDPLRGAVYLGQQGANPFGSLLSIYIAVDDPTTGIDVKLAGKVEPDPVTGRLTTTFVANPQLPFEEFDLSFFPGARASLRTPPKCGTYAITTSLTPHTAPASGPPATPTSSFDVSTGPGGSCPSGALEPSFSAGLTNGSAGAYSPFALRLTRPDASGEFEALNAAPPQGVLAKLAGIPYCPEAGLQQAAARSNPGDAAAEIASPSCPGDSAVGTVTTGVGAGSSPFFTSGKLYLAGPYKGAPLSLAAIVPAKAGPFDLGVVVSRVALKVDSETAQVEAVSDPLPTILSGIPLDVRDLRVDLDRPQFTIAPTNCEQMAVQATVFGVDGSSKALADRFQVDGCRKLGFAPRLSLKLEGGTKRGDYPALQAVLRAKRGDANIGATSVALPHSEFLAQEHIVTICTRVQFAANQCPKGSVYGKARAFSPLLDKPLEGPVYLRSSSNDLPDLVAALRGQIPVDLVGRIDSFRGGIRTTFANVPDAPVSKFILSMKGGKKGLLSNSRNICRSVNKATVGMTGQNGKPHDFRPALQVAGCSHKRRHR
jgi:hypothetical protein